MRRDRLRWRNLSHRQRAFWLVALVALVAATIALQVLVIGDSILVAIPRFVAGIGFGVPTDYAVRGPGVGRSED